MECYGKTTTNLNSRYGKKFWYSKSNSGINLSTKTDELFDNLIHHLKRWLAHGFSAQKGERQYIFREKVTCKDYLKNVLQHFLGSNIQRLGISNPKKGFNIFIFSELIYQLPVCEVYYKIKVVKNTVLKTLKTSSRRVRIGENFRVLGLCVAMRVIFLMKNKK